MHDHSLKYILYYMAIYIPLLSVVALAAVCRTSGLMLLLLFLYKLLHCDKNEVTLYATVHTK